jgi:cobyrinic acid a,c-diamide synthase
MSVPRLIVAGTESGAALDLAAGALLAGLGEQRAVRALMLGLDVPLWRLLYQGSAKAPRVIDPALYGEPVAAELNDHWCQGVESVLYVAVRPALDRWEGIEGTRPIDYAQRFDAPVVLAVDGRDRGATAAAAVLGVTSLARRVEIGGVIVVGADESPAGAELLTTLERDVGVHVVGRIPPQLSEQFGRRRGSVAGVRQLGPKPVEGAEWRLCREAASYLQLEELEAIASRRGYLPSVPRRLLAPDANAAELALAVAWGDPLQPLGLENIDVLQAMGMELRPLNVARDRMLPDGVSGLLIAGQLDEDKVAGFAANRELAAVLTAAIENGLPTLALGGGALLLLRRLSDSRGRSHELVGAIPAEAELIEWYDRPRYVRATATRENPFDEGENVLVELFDLEFLLLEQESFAYRVRTPDGEPQAEGFAVRRCLATTLYPSLPLSPGVAVRFAAAMRTAGVWR